MLYCPNNGRSSVPPSLLAVALLLQLLCQDIDREGDDGPGSKEGVAKDRIVSVHGPGMRSGHKSVSNRLEGNKLAIAADPERDLITAVDVLPANAADSAPALGLVEQSEENTGRQVEETIANCAFGDRITRGELEQAGRKLVAKVPKRPNRGFFPKEDLEIDLEAMIYACPAGQATDKLVNVSRTKPRTGEYEKGQAFQLDGAVCDACELRARCTRAGPGKGRMVSLHPLERLLQEARALHSCSDPFIGRHLSFNGNLKTPFLAGFLVARDAKHVSHS